MTSTITAEDRAASLNRSLSFCSGCRAEREAIIASTIRQAEDAAYERAARRKSDEFQAWLDEFDAKRPQWQTDHLPTASKEA